MLCDCGQTYVVNEDGGLPCVRRKKDSSFRSFITVMCAVLLVYLAIYCLILTVNKNRVHDGENLDSNSTPNSETYDKLHGKLHQNVTETETTTGPNRRLEKSLTTQSFGTQKDREDNKSWTETGVSSTTKAAVESNIAEENERTTSKIMEDKNKGHTTATTTIEESTFPLDETTTTDGAGDESDLYTTTLTATTPERIRTTTTTSGKLDDVGSDKSHVHVQTKEWKAVATTTEEDSNHGHKTQVPTIEMTTISVTNLDNAPETSVKVHQKISSYVDMGANGLAGDETVFLNLNDFYSEKIGHSTKTWTEKMLKDQKIIAIIEKDVKSDIEQIIELTTDNTTPIPKEVTTGMMKNDENKPENATEALVKQDIIKENHVLQLQNPIFIIENVTTPENLQQNNIVPKQTKRICSSPECKTKASEILGRMDHSADPCEDFYQFSCEGRKNGANSMRSQKADVLLEFLYETKTASDSQIKSFKTFFDSCVKYENEFGYSAKIEQVASSNVRTNNLTTLLAFLLMRQTAPLFDVRMGFVDNKEGYGLQVLPPSDFPDTATLENWSLQSHIERECIRNSAKLKYEAEGDLQKVYENFEECLNETFVKKINDFVNLQKKGKKQNEENVRAWKFLLNKVKISTTAIQKAVSDRLYTKTDVANLNKKYSRIDWRELFGKLLCSNFDPSMPIYLYMEEAYFDPLMKDLSRRLVDNEEEILNAIKLYYQLQLYENLVAPKDDVDHFCVNQASSLMPEIAEDIFVRSNPAITDESGRLETTFDELKEKFYWLLDISNMGEGDKNQLKKRLGVLKLATFKAMKNVFVEKYHDDITGDYLSNLLMLLEDKRGMNTMEGFVRNLYTTTFQKFDNPKVIPNENTIVVPNSFIYKVIQNKDTPSYVSEAYAKFHLSRAIAIYLEEVARKFELSFHVQFQRILNRYLEGVDVEINWENQRLSYKTNYELWTSAIDASTSDRTADNIALHIAFGSTFPQNESSATLPWISEDYNAEKQFFVLVVQELCEPLSLVELARNLFGTPNMPGAFRTGAMITNSREFENAFNCPHGSRMNPPDKVEYTVFIPDDYTNYANNYEDQLSK